MLAFFVLGLWRASRKWWCRLTGNSDEIAEAILGLKCFAGRLAAGSQFFLIGCNSSVLAS